MESQNLEELKKLMDRFENDADNVADEKAQQAQVRKEFLDQFEKIKHEVIWPVLVDVGNQLNSYGEDYHVSEDKERVDATAHAEPSSITFNIYPKTVNRAFYKPESTPYIQFAADPYAHKIAVNVSTMMPGKGGVMGLHGLFDIDKITNDLVEKEVVEVLKHTLIFQRES
ncbi:MAG TPA: hypothetical protein PK263_00640 [bacterium]|nr:hypothetical protein [bacterium]